MMNSIPVVFRLFGALLFSSLALGAARAAQPVQPAQPAQPTLFFHNPAQEHQPNPRCNRDLCRTLLEHLDQAQRSIDFALYGLRGQPELLDALIRARQRGVRVRGVVDSNLDGSNYYTDTPVLRAAFPEIVTDQATDQRTAQNQRFGHSPGCERPAGTEGPVSCFTVEIADEKRIIAQASQDAIAFQGDIMHNKFFIIDGEWVWAGSANISDSDVGGYNANVVAVLNSPDLARRYTQEFEQMQAGRFHREKKAYPEPPIALPGGGTVQVLFSPQENIENTLYAMISAARSQINVATFYLTNKRITQALIKARERGVAVRVILDATAAQNEYSKHLILRQAGIPLKVENWGGKMHAKAASFDGQRLLMGSMNWTSAGMQRNDENSLIFEDTPQLVQGYDRDYDQVWTSIPDIWLTRDPRPEGLESSSACSDSVDNDFDNRIDDSDPDCTAIRPLKSTAAVTAQPAAPMPPVAVATPQPQAVAAPVAAPAPQTPAAGSSTPLGANCPPGYPIKGNADSMIYHLPTGAFYLKTHPETCFATPEQAEQQGYRKSQR